MDIRQLIKECVHEEVERQTVKEIIREELKRMYNEGVFEGVNEGVFEGDNKKNDNRKGKKEDNRGEKQHTRTLNTINQIMDDEKINNAAVAEEFFDKRGEGPKTPGGRRHELMDMLNGDDPSSNTDLNIIMSVLHNRGNAQ